MLEDEDLFFDPAVFDGSSSDTDSDTGLADADLRAFDGDAQGESEVNVASSRAGVGAARLVQVDIRTFSSEVYEVRSCIIYATCDFSCLLSNRKLLSRTCLPVLRPC